MSITMLSWSAVLALAAVLILQVDGGQAVRHKRASDDELGDLLKTLLDKKSSGKKRLETNLEDLNRNAHDSSSDDRDGESSATHNIYERAEYVEEMIRYQQTEYERAAAGEDFYRASDLGDVEGRAMNQLSASQQNAIITKHNDLRRKEGGANMAMLRFNPKLATLAQQWADRCTGNHGQPSFSANDVGWKDLGQSYAIHSSKTWQPNDGVQAWFDEKKDYDFNSNGCRGVCGHYTALVWGETTDIGCGVKFCGSVGGIRDAHYLVCNYGPSGNWQGKKPFVPGPACTKCDNGQFFCNNGLCDKSCTAASASCVCKADCKRGGTKTGDCKCKCTGGSIGPDCGEACKDMDDKCGRNPGYPAQFCKMAGTFGELVLKSCPKLCGTCKAKRDNESSNDYILKKLMLEYLQNKHDE